MKFLASVPSFDLEESPFRMTHSFQGNNLLVDKNFPEITAKSLSLNLLIDPKLKTLRSAIVRELGTNSNLAKTLREETECVIDTIAKSIIAIEYDKIFVELTSTPSFKFKMLLPDDIRIIITKSLLGDTNLDEVVFSIFIDTECVLADVKPVHEVVEGINRFHALQNKTTFKQEGFIIS